MALTKKLGAEFIGTFWLVLGKRLFSTLISSTLFLTSSHLFAAPVLFNFTQAGFEEGAVVTGTFVGDDLDGDGRLASTSQPGGINNEIIDFTIQFSGNSQVPSFSFQLDDFDDRGLGFGYDLNGGPLGDGLTLGFEGIAVDSKSSIFVYRAGPGPAEECGIGNTCAFIQYELNNNTGGVTVSSQLITVSTVPIPSAILLFGTGLIGLIGIRRSTL